MVGNEGSTINHLDYLAFNLIEIHYLIIGCMRDRKYSTELIVEEYTRLKVQLIKLYCVSKYPTLVLLPK